MVTRRKRRSAAVPEQPSGSLAIQMPPEKAEPASMGNVLMMVVPMLGSTGVMVFMAIQNGGNNDRSMLMGGGMLVAMLGMVGFNMYRQFSQYRTRVVTQRREYLSYLAETRDVGAQGREEAARLLQLGVPQPQCPGDAGGQRLAPVVARGRHLRPASRSATESGTQPLGLVFERPPIDPMTEMDVVCLSAMERFIDVHDHTDNVGKFLLLGDFSHVELVGRGRGRLRRDARDHDAPGVLHRPVEAQDRRPVLGGSPGRVGVGQVDAPGPLLHRARRGGPGTHDLDRPRGARGNDRHGHRDARPLPVRR